MTRTAFVALPLLIVALPTTSMAGEHAADEPAEQPQVAPAEVAAGESAPQVEEGEGADEARDGINIELGAGVSMLFGPKVHRDRQSTDPIAPAIHGSVGFWRMDKLVIGLRVIGLINPSRNSDVEAMRPSAAFLAGLEYWPVSRFSMTFAVGPFVTEDASTSNEDNVYFTGGLRLAVALAQGVHNALRLTIEGMPMVASGEHDHLRGFAMSALEWHYF